MDSSIDRMASESVPPKKIVFTTAHKKANSIDKKIEKVDAKVESPKEETVKTVKDAKPKKTPKSKKEKSLEQPKETPVESKQAEADSGSNAKPKSLRRRKKSETKSVTTETICNGLKEMTVKTESPSLSVEAAPFIPGATSLAPSKPVTVKERKPVSRPKPVIKPETSDLRSIEVKQLQIRFSPTGFSQKKNSSDDSITMQCVMPITDPDFAYDLETIRLEICIPKGYPGAKGTPIRPTFTILNSDIPSAIITRIERNLRWGLNSLEGGILVCRPMLRYLEDNLEKWMVDDVRESAFKFVKPSEIKVTEKAVQSDSDISEDDSSVSDRDSDDNRSGSHDNTSLSSTKNNLSAPGPSRISVGDWIAPPPVTDQSSVGGNPYTLKLIFSTLRGIDLLTSQSITFLASCDRCKFNFPVEDLRPFVDRIEHCPKCTTQTKFYYKSQLVTPGANYEDGDDEYESILGTIRFLRAKPVDLLPSLYQCACNKCYGSEEDSTGVGNNSKSSCKIEKVKIGENISCSCFNCHQKVRFQIDRIEWISDSPFAPEKKSQKQSSVASKGGPTLTVGNPLPLNGACEHYKKSFRWYRFPCCGQAFPCDECHAKDPVAKGHPVEWATRFICGFCSREQSISVKECPECGKDTSASGRKHTSFWDGGKGTRNQILMSRKDSKKYKDYSLNSKAKNKQ